MPNYKKVKLIAIHMYISELYEKELQYTCQRFRNNSQPEFTDAELMTAYLFIIVKVASENDLTAFKELFVDQIYNRLIFCDQIFSDKPYFDLKADMQNIEMLTPVKLPKGEVDCIRQHEKVFPVQYFQKPIDTPHAKQLSNNFLLPVL